MEKILNSLEELYQLITGTLPEGYVEHNFQVISHCDRYGTYIHPAGYFEIIHQLKDDRVKIVYGKAYKPIITNGRIYKYV